MVSKTKLTGRWKLRSPRRRTASNTSNSGNAAEEQQTTARGSPTPQESPGGTPASSSPGPTHSRLPPPPRGDSTRPERGRSKEHDRHHHRSISDEFRLSDEPSLSASSSSSRVGGGRSRSPLLGLRILAKKFPRKGRPRGDKEEGEGGGGEGGGGPLEQVGGSESTKKTRLGPRGESAQAACNSETLTRKELSGSMHKQKAHNHTPVATAVEEDNTTLARGEVVHAAGTGMLSDDQLKGGKGAKLSDKAKDQRPSQRPPQIAFIGVFLNGIAVALASYAPVGGADARALIKSLLLEPSTPVLPGGRYTASGSALAVHMAVDHKNRVYACLVADDVPLSLAFSLLEEVQIDYLSSVSTLAFSTLEHSHNNHCRPQMAKTVAKYEKVEVALGQERETRRQLGEGLLDIETSLSEEEHKADKGPEVVRLNLDVARHAAALTATSEALLRSSTKRAACGCSPPLGRSRSCKILGAFAAGVATIVLVLLTAKSVYLIV